MIFRIFFITIAFIFSQLSSVAAQQKSIIYKGSDPGDYSITSIIFSALENPEYFELPLLLTKDDIPIVYDDIFLQTQTNVAEIFPGRSRQDGNYYLIDFSHAEIKQLSYTTSQSQLQVTHHLTSLNDAFSILSTLAKEFEIQPTLLPLIKYPWFHANEKKNISEIVIKELIAQRGSVDSQLFIKCYDPEELQRIHKEFLPGLPVEIRLVQGIDRKNGRETMQQKRGKWYSYNYDWLFTRLGLRVVAGYADSISLVDQYVTDEATLSRLITDAQGLKMRVFIGIDDSQSSAAVYDQLLFSFNADGLALSKAKPLQEFLAGRKQDASGFNMSEDENIQENTPSSILSDPEALSERLKSIQ